MPQETAIPKDVVSAVKAGATSVRVAELLGVDLTREGTTDRMRGLCPLPGHGKQRGLKPGPFVAYDSGGWHCFGCNEGNGDGISLYRAARGTGFRETIRALEELLGIAVDLPGNGHGKTAPWSAAAKRATPATASPSSPTATAEEWTASEEPTASLRYPKLGTPSRTWEIRSPAGRLFGLLCRFELPGKGKRFAWWRRGLWSLKCPECFPKENPPKSCPQCMTVARAPLYSAERLAGWDQSGAVIVTEGPKAADALQGLHLQAVATVTGAAGTPSPESLAALAGWTGPVVCWPDRDDVGEKHMARVRKNLPPGLDVRTFAPSDLPDKGDAVEWLAARPGADPGELLGEILAAAERSPAEAEPDAGAYPLPAAASGGLDFQDLDAFCSEAENLPDALVGTAENCSLPAGGMLLLYGDGGAGKTTLALDFVAHAASGTAWLGLPIARPLKILVIENEGPRPHFRGKFKKKLDGWEGRPFADNVRVLRDPWAGLTFLDDAQRQALAQEIEAFGADVVVAGPLASLGAGGAGTPDDVTAFENLVKDLRRRSRKDFALVLIHHENKAGAISGAWTRVPDSLVHMEAQGNGRSRLTFQKMRWASELHGMAWNVCWEGADGFRREDAPAARNYEAEILAFLATLADGEWCSQATASRAIKAAVPRVREALKALMAAGAVDLREGGPGVPANTHGYRLAGPCLKSPDTGKHEGQGTLPGVSDVGACLPCPSPVRGHGERHARTRHPAARVSPSETPEHGDGSEDDGSAGSGAAKDTVL